MKGIDHPTWQDVAAAVARSRTEHPEPAYLFSDLVIGVGSLAAGLRDGAVVRTHAVQLAALALRLVEEGDGELVTAGELAEVTR